MFYAMPYPGADLKHPLLFFLFEEGLVSCRQSYITAYLSFESRLASVHTLNTHFKISYPSQIIFSSNVMNILSFC